MITLLREFWPRINYILTLPTEIFGKDTPRDYSVTSMVMQEKPSNTVKFTVAVIYNFGSRFDQIIFS